MKPLSPAQREALALVAEGRFFPDLVKEDDGWHARWRAAGEVSPVVDGWVDEYVRRPSITAMTEDAEDQRHETLHDAWAMALRSRTGLVVWDDTVCATFAKELAAWHGGAKEDVAARRALVFRLCAASRDAAFTLTCPAPKGRAQYRALGQSVYVWSGMRNLKKGPDGFLSVVLARGDAEDFIRRGADALRAAGYSVEKFDFSVRVTAVAEIGGKCASSSKSSKGAKTNVSLTIKIDGETVSAADLRFLIDQGSSLVFFRDRWIEIDRAVVRNALRALERSKKTRANTMSFALGVGALGKMEIEDVFLHGAVRGLVNRLRQSRAAAQVPDAGNVLPELDLRLFAGTLRDYQKRGAAWISFLTDNGFGALLADDMGFGKTIQTIAWLAHTIASGEQKPFLVVAPLTLLANWRHELEKFAPSLCVYVHQGDLRHVASGFKKAVGEAHVVVTNYSLVVRDHREFAEIEWAGVILDEAQAIKNPDTHAARAICAFGARRRLALTGTPVENSIKDIWSLEEFLNPGFLGERCAFEERFVKPLALDPHNLCASRLRHALEPFVLRRLKSEPSIVGELGDKREIREYCTLGSAQRADYERALADWRQGDRRAGDVLALLTRLKLICDGFDGERVSGAKADRLVELVETILANGESVLVFTQYAKVGEAICRLLSGGPSSLVPPPFFLHGQLSAAQREREVARFNGAKKPSVFVLVLKAGGFGLNLTKATHVVHYDRWWNPAVESQATDRAHRIGQRRTVFVHVLVSEGTLEERIEGILSRKESLASLLKDGEAFWRTVQLSS